jgi:hypothetical protein
MPAREINAMQCNVVPLLLSLVSPFSINFFEFQKKKMFSFSLPKKFYPFERVVAELFRFLPRLLLKDSPSFRSKK